MDGWYLRTSAQLQRQRLHSDQLPENEKEPYLQSIGVNDFDSGVVFPGWDVECAVVDVGHCEMEGNLTKHYMGTADSTYSLYLPT